MRRRDALLGILGVATFAGAKRVARSYRIAKINDPFLPPVEPNPVGCPPSATITNLDWDADFVTNSYSLNVGTKGYLAGLFLPFFLSFELRLSVPRSEKWKLLDIDHAAPIRVQCGAGPRTGFERYDVSMLSNGTYSVTSYICNNDYFDGPGGGPLTVRASARVVFTVAHSVPALEI